MGPGSGDPGPPRRNPSPWGFPTPGRMPTRESVPPARRKATCSTVRPSAATLARTLCRPAGSPSKWNRPAESVQAQRSRPRIWIFARDCPGSRWTSPESLAGRPNRQVTWVSLRPRSTMATPRVSRTSSRREPWTEPSRTWPLESATVSRTPSTRSWSLQGRASQSSGRNRTRTRAAGVPSGRTTWTCRPLEVSEVDPPAARSHPHPDTRETATTRRKAPPLTSAPSGEDVPARR